MDAVSARFLSTMYRRESSSGEDDESSDDESPPGRSLIFARESLTFTEAAAILLRGATTPDEVLTRLVLVDYLQPRVIASPCIDSHDLLLLPQARQPARVHRFILSAATLLPLSAQLASDAQAQRTASAGINVSNVDGWHSAEEMFEFDVGNMRWYNGLRDALSDVLRALDCDTRGLLPPTNAPDVPLTEREVSGWLNSSGRRAYNTLHDHGGPVEWSLVLFVKTGEEALSSEAEQLSQQSQLPQLSQQSQLPQQTQLPQQSQLPQQPQQGQGEERPPRVATEPSADEHPCGGSLLMKTQPDWLKPNEQSYLAIPPKPGELWAFQGDMMHAVLPREIGRDGVDADVATRLQGMQRISVAMNVYKAEHLR